MPEIPTAREQGYDLSTSSDRGLIACKDIDPEALQKITETLQSIQKNPDFIAEAADKGLGINMLFGNDFEDYIENVEKSLKSMMDQFGWSSQEQSK